MNRKLGGLPKLRDDLEIRQQTTDHGTVVVIKDPVAREFYRLTDVGYFVARQLDGRTALDEVRRRTEEHFGSALGDEALATLVASLRRNGLLGDARNARPLPRRLTGSAFHLRLRLFDPDRLLDALTPRLRWLFTPAFGFLSALLILSAVGLTALHWGEVARDAARLYKLSAVPLLVATVFFVIALHELGHGLACKRYGGQVREMGFLLMYFQPALYVNVSDAWLFAEKSKRLLVGLAGPYFELIVWALAAIVWRVTDPASWINFVALVVMTTSGIKTLLNFNPLIKLDGYYLLSDYLDIANLRQKSFDFVGASIRKLVGLAHEPQSVTPRERRIFLGYGLVAMVFSLGLLGYVGVAMGGQLLEQDQRALFVAFAGVLGSRVRLRFRRLFRGESNRPRKREPFPTRRKWAVGTLLLVILAALFATPMQLRVAGPAEVLPLHNADVRAEVAGIIEEVVVDEGDPIDKGDLVARLSDRDLRAELQKTHAEIEQTHARLSLLVAGPTPEQIAVARAAVAKAEDRHNFARERLSRDTELYQQELISRSDFDTTRELESTAHNEWAEAKSQLDVLLKGSRQEDIEAMRAESDRLDAHRRYLEEQLALIDVVSPAAGIVTTPSRQLRELVRQTVQRGDLIAKVFELERVTVQAAIPEREIAGVQIGQPVVVKVRAYPGRAFRGRIARIATTARDDFAGASAATALVPGSASGAKSANSVLVMTEIDNHEGLLKPGMTGVAKIYCGERRFIALVMRRLSLTFKVEFWSWW